MNFKYELEYKERAKELVSKMTLEEKIFQMLHKAPSIERLDIKAYNWWNEGLHGVARAGVATVFPQAIGLSATFDEKLLEEVADVISTEARGKFNMQQKYSDYDIYKGLTFWSPNINIFRDPRWGRGHETYGEDPYLTGKLGVAFINGLQGKDERYLKLVACAKHFAVHSGPEDIRHSFDAKATNQDLAETYLPAFEMAVKDAKVESVMGAYNRTNGEPCCGSELLLENILRKTWEFDGHVVSDCWAIKDFHEYHKVTNSPAESVALAVNKGCDLNCGNLFVYLIESVEKGLVTEEAITKSVERLFTSRMKLGMFDNFEDVPFNKISYDEVDSKEHQKFNLEVARQTLVMLKNENGTLPLNYNEIKTIGVIGPNANSRKALVGNYEGTSSRYVTILEGIQDYLKDENSDVRVVYSEGCHLFRDRVGGLGEEKDRFSEAKAICDMSDVIIVCTGLDAGLEGEEGDQGNEFASGDKPNLELPGLQNELIEIAVKTGKKVIVVNLSGSAIALNYADEKANAVIQGWYPGAQGGRAIAELLFGEFSPSGKLPVTFYKTSEELPEFVDYSMKNRTYRYMKNEALYPFGYGLTYGKVEINKLELDRNSLSNKGVNVSCTIKNIGSVDLKETIQGYIKFNNNENESLNYQLKILEKVDIKASEEKEIKLFLPIESFGLADENGDIYVNAGEYSIFVGVGQPDVRTEKLTGTKSLVCNLKADETVFLKKLVK